MTAKEKVRCTWAKTEPNRSYHDTEWGVPVHDDRTFFEFLILEGAQAGLSWETILRKRDAYREAFDNFDVVKIVKYTPRKLEQLMKNPGIVRNRLKIESSVKNARAFLAVQDEFGSFDNYVWQFVGGKPLRKKRTVMSDIPAKTVESDVMSRTLLKRGFKFVGSTICYAFMQATGLVNDHLESCFRSKEIRG